MMTQAQKYIEWHRDKARTAKPEAKEHHLKRIEKLEQGE